MNTISQNSYFTQTNTLLRNVKDKLCNKFIGNLNPSTLLKISFVVSTIFLIGSLIAAWKNRNSDSGTIPVLPERPLSQPEEPPSCSSSDGPAPSLPPSTSQPTRPIILLDTPEDKAATVIQKHFRGYQSRKAHLPRDLFPHYRQFCEFVTSSDDSTLHSIPRAGPGKTVVYLPNEMPEVVFKRSGNKDAINRFHQMQVVRSILDSQNSSHLIIPKANLYQNFLVEQRLAINVDLYHNMELYIFQPELFDEAVREMTRLFSMIHLSDLVGSQRHPLGNISGVEDSVRYDNLPLYIVEENGKRVGKIGLIDLEHMQEDPSPRGLETLVRIFPYHLDVITDEANKLNMQVNNGWLEATAARGRRFLQVGFIDHRTWLEQKGVSTEIAPYPFQISAERVEELTTLVEKELLKINAGDNEIYGMKSYTPKPPKDFFKGNPKEVAKEMAASITPLIIHRIATRIEKNQNASLSKLSGQNMTVSELVSLRSPTFYRPWLYKGVTRYILDHPKIDRDTLPRGEQAEIAEQLLYVMMRNLMENNEIFYYDPAYYSSGHNLCWIRY